MRHVSRLYNKFLPHNYRIELNIDTAGRTFSGSVRINGIVTNNKQPLQLHIKDLAVSSMKIDGHDAASSNSNDDTIIVHDPVDPGDHTIECEFSGNITDTMHGLYPCYYEDDGLSKEIFVTQFESHHAREVFPCIDEPEAKATFDLAITTADGLSVLSNTELDRTTRLNSEKTTHTFKTTPRMSTYLLAFAIGNFHKVESKTKGGTKVRVFATPNQPLNRLEFALSVATQAIDFFEDYFGVKYPLEKSDHLAVPDFSSGAMENWGLITYRERALLVDPTTPQSSKELVATVICHELSHQWFGNLVTMRWWDDLWLNESFANLMEYVAVDYLYPDWNIWLDFAVKESAVALSRDYIYGVQPVSTPVHSPDEISLLFDPAIVYAKGSRLLLMLKNLVGDTVFRTSLKKYFETHAYDNTSSDDLWRAFDGISDYDIKSLMTPWLHQPGFPVVSVSVSAGHYTLEQHRLVVGHYDKESLWTIPVAANESSFPKMLATKRTEIPLAISNDPILNVGGVSHYVTLYDDEMLDKVLNQATKTEFATIDRVTLMFDQLMLVRAGEVSADHLVGLLDKFRANQEQNLWSVMIACMGELKMYCLDESDREVWNQYVQSIVLPLVEQLGIIAKPDDDESVEKLRAMVLMIAIKSHHVPTIESLLIAADSNNNLTGLGELRAVYLIAQALSGSRETFAKLLVLHDTTSDVQLRQEVADALAMTEDEDHIALLLHRLTDRTKVKPQDVIRWFVMLIRNSYAREQTWQWMVRNWIQLVEIFAGDKSFESFPRYSAAAMSTTDEYEAYSHFFNPMQITTALQRTINIGKRELKNRSELVDSNRALVINAMQRAVSVNYDNLLS